MPTSRPPSLHRAVAPIAAFGLIAVAACSGSPATTSSTAPPSTPTAIVSPSPTPLTDPAVAFEHLLDDPDLTARVTILDVTESTDPAGAYRMTSDGTLEFAGIDERERYEIWVDGKKVETADFISIGSEEWKRTDGGPWTASDAADDEPFLMKLHRIEEFQSLGKERMGSRDLHHLRLAEGLTPDLRDWGPSDARFSNVAVDLDFWVDDDGIPVLMEMRSTFTYTEGGQAVEFERQSVRMFEAVGGNLEIERPDGA